MHELKRDQQIEISLCSYFTAISVVVLAPTQVNFYFYFLFVAFFSPSCFFFFLLLTHFS